MAFTSVLRWLSATSVTKTFTRKRAYGDGLTYTVEYSDHSILGSPSILENGMKVRLTSKPGSSPDAERNSHNTNRTMKVKGADGKVYTASVNLTVQFPGGDVISLSALSDMVRDVVIVATNLTNASDPDSEDVGIGNIVDSQYMSSVRFQEA